MKWMQGWSWDDLLDCPVHVKAEIVLMINEEIEAKENQ